MFLIVTEVGKLTSAKVSKSRKVDMFLGVFVLVKLAYIAPNHRESEGLHVLCERWMFKQGAQKLDCSIDGRVASARGR